MSRLAKLLTGLIAASTGLWAAWTTPLLAESKSSAAAQLGRELAIPRHLKNGEEFELTHRQLIEAGRNLFSARWTSQEGQGRPLTKGDGHPLSDPTSPLVFPRNFNRVSGPDTASCAICHNTPLIGGGGDFAMNVFVLGERFDFATFDASDPIPTRGARDEHGELVTLQTIANSRKVVGMFGSGYIEMLARQMTTDLRAIALDCALGERCPLSTKGISFGTLGHNQDGTWDTSEVEGLPEQSLRTLGTTAPSLIIRPLHQSGTVASLRQFTVEAFNQHHGMQAEEKFGTEDEDGDGFVRELTRADLTAVTLFQATLPVPGQVIPRHRRIRRAIRRGERLFERIGCATCHTTSLPLTDDGWHFVEPGPFNPRGTLQQGKGVSVVTVDLNSDEFDPPRLEARRGVVQVPAYTDLKLHDITTGKPSCSSNPELIATGDCDGDVEPLNQNVPSDSDAFVQGNARFITRKLWGIANQHAFGHHGQYTTMREAILAHFGEANATREAFLALSERNRNALIEFLKSLQILRPGTPCRVVDEHYHCLSER